MFNKRWKKVLAWCVAVVLLLGIGGLFAANYAVDKLMTSMADSIDLESDDLLGSGQGDVVAAEPSADNGSTPVAAEPQPSAVPAGNGSVPSVQQPSGTEGDNSKADNTAKTDKGNMGNTAAANPAGDQTSKAQSGTAGQAPEQQTSSDKQSNQSTQATTPPKKEDAKAYSAQVSTDKAKHIKENVTVGDKANVASIVLGQLSMSDIKRLQELASGGLTVEEKREARKIILDKVSPEQYNELSEIAKKYGVSQGKTYDQVQKEEQGSEQQ
ncbi:hypothetical protein ACE6ED_27990 [Paenibacillus sp. CN-4]|uniref:hypothetical protein n=1 Tax=Paenibacillus nanchangensis TaxID=3348343 RepID=UPI00397CE8DE